MAQFVFDTTNPAPRVNFELMGQYIGKKVKLVGRVEGIQGNVLRVKAADEGAVDVVLKGAAPQDAFVEIDGIVENPNTLREESHAGFGNNFDMANYNELCKTLNGNYRQLFM